jgi:hypothetical protein
MDAPSAGRSRVPGVQQLAQPPAEPSEPIVLRVSSRRVRLPGGTQPEPSLYKQVRLWMLNDPDLIPPQEVRLHQHRSRQRARRRLA